MEVFKVGLNSTIPLQVITGSPLPQQGKFDIEVHVQLNAGYLFSKGELFRYRGIPRLSRCLLDLNTMNLTPRQMFSHISLSLQAGTRRCC